MYYNLLYYNMTYYILLYYTMSYTVLGERLREVPPGLRQGGRA